MAEIIMDKVDNVEDSEVGSLDSFVVRNVIISSSDFE
jgi:hypothetical protein